MSEKEKILGFISEARETPCVDFKRDFYAKLSQSDLPKDVCAFANSISNEDKYIVFGVEDKTREIVGINEEEFIGQDSIDEYISRTIEPFVEVECGTFNTDDGKIIGYIKILSSNANPPYVIKEDCGKSNKLSKGDVFIRKGSCNQRALRSDFDSMYLKNGDIIVRLHENLAIIEPIYMEGELVQNPTYGRIDVEIFNDTTRPVLICGGDIVVEYKSHTLRRRIVSILPNRIISERPLELTAQSRKVYTVLFDFLSQDCVDLNFYTDGKMDSTVNMSIKLYDTDNNQYLSDPIEGFLIAKGDVLHKVNLKCYLENKQKMKFWDRVKFRFKN